MKKENALDAAKMIKMLVFDVDGVMTDGSITYDENGVEYKTFNAKVTAIITARNNGTVQHRAKNLNFTELYQGRKYKLPALMELMEKYNLSYENISYMGDDLPDICILEKVGLAILRLVQTLTNSYNSVRVTLSRKIGAET